MQTDSKVIPSSEYFHKYTKKYIPSGLTILLLTDEASNRLSGSEESSQRLN